MIIKKYKETCLFCSKQEGTFEACHIFEVKNILSLSEAESDNLLNSLQLSHIDESSNFLSLCSVCHTMFDDFKLTCPKYNEDQNTITLEANSNIDRHHSTNKTQTIYDLEKFKSLQGKQLNLFYEDGSSKVSIKAIKKRYSQYLEYWQQTR